MAWTRVCGITDVVPGTAVSCNVQNVDVLVINSPDGIDALTSVCANVWRFLMQGDYRQCVVGGVPTCNRRTTEVGHGEAQKSSGVCDEPIYVYAARERNGSVEIDLEKKHLSRYEHITCSPVIEAGTVAALQFSLWLDGTHVHRALGRPLRRGG